MTRYMANRIEPPRLRKRSGCAETNIDKILAQPTITAAPPNRGRMNHAASTQTSEKHGWATVFFSVIVVCMVLVRHFLDGPMPTTAVGPGDDSITIPEISKHPFCSGGGGMAPLLRSSPRATPASSARSR